MLGKKHSLYSKDIWAGYEDDWALEHFNDLWKGDFYLKWWDETLEPEVITVLVEKFSKWNMIVELKF